MGYAEQWALEDIYVMHTFGRKPVEFVEGKGMLLYDDEGRSYLDFLSGIGVASLGHCHPAVVQAISDQAQKLIHVGNYYYIEGRGELARTVSKLLSDAGKAQEASCGEEGEAKVEAADKLDAVDSTAAAGTTGSAAVFAATAGADSAADFAADPEAWQSFFANSGAEANECAIKLARLYARKKAEAAGGDPLAAPQHIVTLKQSFHGRTLATLAATAQPAKQELFQPLPGGFMHAPINDIKALEELFARQGESICAVMLEPVQGESGVHLCDADYLQAVAGLAHDHGALLICDEVQCGIYRCGDHPFAFQHAGVAPDIVTIAKGIASGFPMGICAARTQVAAAFAPGDHGSTFGGSCLAIAAASATLATLAETGTAERISRVGSYLRTKLATLPHVLEVRGRGLMCACDLDQEIAAPAVVERALAKGLVINSTGPQTLRFLPPLICTEADADAMIERLEQALD